MSAFAAAPAAAVHAPGVPAAPRARSVAAWSARGGLALADQALYAGAHFLLNILLARWLSPADYGAFALAYSVFLLVAALYSALVLEPMTVFGSGKYLPVKRSYLGVLFRGHLALTIPAAAILVGGAVLAGTLVTPAAKNSLLALGLLSPVLLLGWLTRRAFYLELQPGKAAAGSVIYFALLFAAAFWLFRREALSPMTAILAMAFAASAAAGAQTVWLRPEWTARTVARTAEIVHDHWRYGRWALASAVAMWFPLNVYYYVLPATSGLEGAGALKALLNLANPVLHALVALGLVLTPALVRQRERGGVTLMHQTVWNTVATCLAASSIYLLLVWTFRTEIIEFLYNGTYREYSGAPVLLVGVLPLASSATITFGSALRALEQPKVVFWSYAIFCGTAAIWGIPLSVRWGLTGALAGMLLSYLALVLAMLIFYYRALSRPRGDARVQPSMQEQG